MLPSSAELLLFRAGTARTIAVATRTTSFTPRTARATGTAGALRAIFIGRDLSVAILVQLLQGIAGLGNLVGIDDAILVEVQCLDEGRHGTLSPGTAWAARARFTAGRASAGAAFALLGLGVVERGGQGQGEEQCCCFHDTIRGLLFPSPAVCIDTMQWDFQWAITTKDPFVATASASHETAWIRFALESRTPQRSFVVFMAPL